MENSILMNDLSVSKMDKVITNDEVKAGWELVISDCESWFFTFTNEDNSSGTKPACGYATCE